MVGSFPAMSYQRGHDSSTKRLLLALARSAGISPEVSVSGAGTSEVEVRRLTSDRVQFVFAFNHAPTPAQATITIRLGWPQVKGQNVNTDQPVPLRVVRGEVVLQKTFAAGEVWIVKLTPP